MLNTQWSPFDLNGELKQLQAEMQRRFGRYGGRYQPQSVPASFPAVNLWEDSDNYYVEAELPGFDPNNLEIYVTAGNQLTLKGQRTASSSEDAVWHRQERSYGSFQRVIELPGNVASDQVSAESKYGVLRITLPKPAQTKPRRIDVLSS